MEKLRKKILKERFEALKPSKGVLSVRNKQNNRVYFKGSVNLEALMNKMFFMLNSGSYENKALQHDWQKFGPDAFVFEKAVVLNLDENPFADEKKELLKAEALLKTQLTAAHELY